MGTTVQVVVLAADARDATRLADHAMVRIAELERRWTRFHPTSDLSLLNGAAGCLCAVSPELFLLVDHAVAAWRATDGAFDPTVHDAMVANGYDRPFGELDQDRPGATGHARRAGAAPGCAGIRLDAIARTVFLPIGTRLDPGGIGKGLAADLVATELRQLGACGVLVDIGGDLQTIGDGPEDGSWVIDIEAPPGTAATPTPATGATLARVAIGEAGIATSSTRRRCWGPPGARRHHLVDPATGQMLDGPYVAATVITTTAWWAEALTKVVLVKGVLAPSPDASVLAVDRDGAVHTTPELAHVRVDAEVLRS